MTPTSISALWLSADAASAAALLSSMAAPLPLAALWIAGDQVAARRRLLEADQRPDQQSLIPRRKGWNPTVFVAGKVFFLTLAFGIPALYHPVGVVLVYYLVAGLVTGMVFSVVFQSAHCVEEAEFPLPRKDTGRIEHPWAIHQTETTVDFARNSRVVAWLVGGLNFQIEHHLFPKISHVNYPAISRLAGRYLSLTSGIKYTEHRSFRAGLASHFRWLKRMGRPNAVENDSPRSGPGTALRLRHSRVGAPIPEGARQ